MACECGLLHEHVTEPIDCHDCGAACCPSCVLPVGPNTYCRWCAITAAA